MADFEMNRPKKYKLVYYGSEILQKVAREVMNIDQGIKDLVETMFNIMYEEMGIGLAAPQVGVQKSVLVVDLAPYNGPSLALINAAVLGHSGNTGPYEEGCLSVPGVRAVIQRPTEVSVRGITPEGREITINADGLLARVLQHEIDHLNGKLFIDHLEDFEKKELMPELRKIKKLGGKS
jgi:peptide deformylase